MSSIFSKYRSKTYALNQRVKRRSAIVKLFVQYDETANTGLPYYPKDPGDEALIKNAIESNDFLSKIKCEERLKYIIQCMYNKQISANETIIEQGEKGSRMYVSAKGKFQVIINGKVNSRFSDLKVFGEIAILYNTKEWATVKAVTSGTAWVLDRDIYQQIVQRHNVKEQDEIMEFLMTNRMLNVAGDDALQEVASSLKLEFFPGGKQISSKGKKDFKFYIIRAGTVTITRYGDGIVGSCKKGDCFGELALLKEYTVITDPPAVECLTLTRTEFIDHFRELKDLTEIKIRPPLEPQGLGDYLKIDDYLEELDLREEYAEPTDVPVVESLTLTEQEFNNGFEEAKYTQELQETAGSSKETDRFEELHLPKSLPADPADAQCSTLTEEELIDTSRDPEDFIEDKLCPPLGSRNSIDDLVPEHEDIKLTDLKYTEVSRNSIDDLVPEHEDIKLIDLKLIKSLGVGGFGRVELVQHVRRKDLVFALKYMRKIDIVELDRQEHTFNEKKLQMACRSPFIVKLYRTYRDSKYIYLLMESCLGGDVWRLLQERKFKGFSDKTASFIAACVLEAFDHLHSQGIIYRDLKPENLLVAENGYIKLTDFGFAKKIHPSDRTFTFGGTPEYIAPEMILNKGHNRAVDYWAFGVFIFELLAGKNPFRTGDSVHLQTMQKILKGIDNIQFPRHIGTNATSIIKKLCRPVPSERLGMQGGGIKDIKSHKWFLGLDWQKFAKCGVPSPFKPKLKGPTDTRYFDQFKKDTDIPSDETSGWDVEF